MHSGTAPGSTTCRGVRAWRTGATVRACAAPPVTTSEQSAHHALSPPAPAGGSAAGLSKQISTALTSKGDVGNSVISGGHGETNGAPDWIVVGGAVNLRRHAVCDPGSTNRT